MGKLTGAHGWPLVPSTVFPGELTLACPKCGSTHVILTGAPWGTWGFPGGTWDQATCDSCGHTTGRVPVVMKW